MTTHTNKKNLKLMRSDTITEPGISLAANINLATQAMNATAREGLVPCIRESLDLKIERLLQRPLIARLLTAQQDTTHCDERLPGAFRALQSAAQRARPSSSAACLWQIDPQDRTCTVPVCIDYADLWRGHEKEVLENVKGTVESCVAFLTEEQRVLLEKSPREYLDLNPSPETAELIDFKVDVVGGCEQVVELVVAEPPESPRHIRYVAIVPNLVPLERQLDALAIIEQASDDSHLAPLRSLLSLNDASQLKASSGELVALDPASRFDRFQAQCVQQAMTTPHFAVIQGPPGSGKTTVITEITRQAINRNERVLIVSPTHVAVDNVVEKLPPNTGDTDDLAASTIPLRYAARPNKLLKAAAPYWVGPTKQKRMHTLAQRVENRLCQVSPLARELYPQIDADNTSNAPLTEALGRASKVICGTPIGILSFDEVKWAEPAAFDLLITDEVSKMTLPEFLAVAVKAKRWVLVGDPEQLPPYNDAVANGSTLDRTIPPAVELVCSVGAIVQQTKMGTRRTLRLLLVALQPERVAAALGAHFAEIKLDQAPKVTSEVNNTTAGIVVCRLDQVDQACAALSPVNNRDRTDNPEQRGSVRILAERGLGVPRQKLASGIRHIEPKECAQALLFDKTYKVYHAKRWTRKAQQALDAVWYRDQIENYLPSTAAIALTTQKDHKAASQLRDGLIGKVAEFYAVNTVSVYDWLVGMPTRWFDISLLKELERVAAPLAKLRQSVLPYVGTLKNQFRMHPSLSVVPRLLFYHGQALEDGLSDDDGSCRVILQQVDNDDSEEKNQAEADAIREVLMKLNASGVAESNKRTEILLITPYKKQERLLQAMVNDLARHGDLEHVDVEVCTIDRCQGREASYVLISLVRNRSTLYFDSPKRWCVALTRAKEGLHIFGDIESYLSQAQKARRRARGKPPRMRLLARILETYDRQIAGLPLNCRR